MPVPERFAITIYGTTSRANSRSVIVPGALGRYFEAMLVGQHVPDETWAAFGLRVDVEVDCDQGDDG